MLCIQLLPDPNMLRSYEKQLIAAASRLGSQMAVEAVLAVGALAEHAPDVFGLSNMSYGVYDGIKRLMSDTSGQGCLVRAAAIETAGIFVVSTTDQLLIEDFASIAIEGLDFDESNIQQATFSFFERMIDYIGGSVIPVYGSRLLHAARNSLEREDVVSIEHEDGYRELHAVRTSYWHEKMSAIACIGSIATAMASETCLQKYPTSCLAETLTTDMNRCIIPLQHLTTYDLEDIRAYACRAQARMASGNTFLRRIKSPLSFAGDGFAQATLHLLLSALIEDNDFWVVTGILHALAAYFTEAPTRMILEFKQHIMDAIKSLIYGESAFQLAAQGNDEDIDIDAKRDEDHIGEILDVIEALAYRLRGYFAKHFVEVLYELTNLYTTNTSTRSRVW